MKDSIFREYDIRGKFPNDINEDVAYKIGLGYGSFIQEFLMQEACVVSYDNRPSSEKLHDSLIKGLTETGLKVIDYGLTTTPMHYYARHINNLFGIMITASHENDEYNGFKFSFDEYSDAKGIMVRDLKTYIDKGNFKSGNGTIEEKDIKDEYINYLTNHLKFGKRNIKVIFDLNNGTTSTIINDVLKSLNINYILVNNDNLEERVKELNANIAIKFDGDGDSFQIYDELGNLVSIEDYGIIILKNLIDKVENKKFLFDNYCSDSFKKEIEKLNGISVTSMIGTNYGFEKIIKDNIPFGIHSNGTAFLNDRLYCTGSAIYGALRLIEVLSKTDKTLSELVNTTIKYFSNQKTFESTNDKKNDVINNIKKYCNEKNYNYIEQDGLKVIFKDSWAYIRASKTNDNIILTCNSNDKNNLDNLEKIFTTLIDIYNK